MSSNDYRGSSLAQIISQLKSQGNAVQDYLAVARSCEGTLTVGYKPSSGDGLGQFYTVGPAAQQLPRKVRLLLFGHNHCEIDISGAHYELVRRCCAQTGAHGSLPPIQATREWLKAVLTPPDPQALSDTYEGLVKKWPLVIINSDTPQEALTFLSRQLPHLAQPLPPEITRFALELHAASRYVINRPPTWCPARERDRSRAAPFRFFETLEQHLTWAAYSFLQPIVGFHSAIWLHDGFWAAPCPTEEHLAALHRYILLTAIASLLTTHPSFAVNCYGKSMRIYSTSLPSCLLPRSNGARCRATPLSSTRYRPKLCSA